MLNRGTLSGENFFSATVSKRDRSTSDDLGRLVLDGALLCLLGISLIYQTDTLVKMLLLPMFITWC